MKIDGITPVVTLDHDHETNYQIPIPYQLLEPTFISIFLLFFIFFFFPAFM